jgi:hypothetical protein
MAFGKEFEMLQKVKKMSNFCSILAISNKLHSKKCVQKKYCMILVNYVVGLFSWACYIWVTFNMRGLNYWLFYTIHATTCSSGIGIMKVGKKIRNILLLPLIVWDVFKP